MLFPLLYKCNKQIGSYECDYYVMQWMTTILRARIANNWELVIFALNEILICKTLSFYILIEIIVLCA